MNRKTRKKQIMKEMHANDKAIVGVEDYLINLGYYQQYALIQTFGKKDAPNLSFEELLDFYRHLNASFELDLNKEIHTLQHACKEFMRSAIVGTQKTNHRRLNSSSNNNSVADVVVLPADSEKNDFNPVLLDAEFKLGERTRAFDAIRISRGGVVLMELWKPNQSIRIDENGNCCISISSASRDKRFSLLEWLEASKDIVSDILEACGITDVPIIPLVLFEDDWAMSNHSGAVRAIQVSKLPDYLDNVDSRSMIPESVQKRIREVLDEANEQTNPEKKNYGSGFVAAYADLRSKVEACIKGSDSDEEGAVMAYV